MRFFKTELLYYFLIFIISCIFVSDLFLHAGRPATFDSTFHITNIAQYYLALKSGDFPVVWLNGFANYGLPIGIVAHQFTSYLGAVINFFTHDPVTSFNIVGFIGILFANIFYYIFLRIYFSPRLAFLATFLFNFSVYRIINFYIRGALPEVFSNLFLPLILMAMYYFVKKRQIKFLLLLAISFFGLTLNHPMMLLIYSLIYIPYLFFVIFVKDGKISKKYIENKENLKLCLITLLTMILGVAMAGYYLIPLNFEIKFFYYGLSKDHLTPDSYLSFKNYFDPKWYYFTQNEILTRGHVINAGPINTIAIISGIIFVVWRIVKKKWKEKLTLLEFCLLVSFLVIFFTTKFSNIFYVHISFLNDIQFPWRMLSAFMFLPPIIYAILIGKLKYQKYIIAAFILLVCLITFPQIYGKNYSYAPASDYYFSKYNAHSVLMNSIWTGKTEDYPVKNQKIDIIQGEGKIISQNIKNSSRTYTIDAKTSLRLVDYTFYFPGWNAYVDGVKTDIQFQDPHYRGVVTYQLPAGQHTVLLKFEDTKIRKIGKIVSVLSFISMAGFLLILKRLRSHF